MRDGGGTEGDEVPQELCPSPQGFGEGLNTHSISAVREFHAHIYFDVGELSEAQALADRARALFGVAVGRFHEKPIGPHPRGSCQLTVATDVFGAFACWAALNRDGLTIFAHADTGDDSIDHSRNVIWFGPSEALDLSIFDETSEEPPPA